MCRFTVDVAVRPSCIYNSLEEKLNHDYCQTSFHKRRSAAAEAANVQDSWSALQGHSRQRKGRCLFRRRLHYSTVRQVQPTAYLLEFFSRKLTHLRSALSSTPVGALANTPSRIAYTPVGTGAPATAVSLPTRRRTGPGAYGRLYN